MTFRLSIVVEYVIIRYNLNKRLNTDKQNGGLLL